MNWAQIVNKVTPHIVKIETQTGYGTGFLLLYNEKKTFCGIATALHVVEHAESWQQPIRILHHASNETIFLPESNRVIFTNWETDSAVIFFPKADFPLPKDPISLFSSNSIIDIGVEVGWLGFPAVAPYDLCFFSGNISAKQERRKAYLIDGVAINGVSGGPVVHATEAEGPQIVGTISEYHANRATGEALPGLCIAQDVSHFHDVVSTIQSIDEANRKKAEIEESHQEKAIEVEDPEEKKVDPAKQPPQGDYSLREHEPRNDETHEHRHLRYWTGLREYMVEKGSSVNCPLPTTYTYLRWFILIPNFYIQTSMLRSGKEIRVWLYLKGDNAKAHFHLLKEQQQEIHNDFGERLEWHELSDNERSRICFTKGNTDPLDENDWPHQYEWFTTHLELFVDVFRERIQSLNAADWIPTD